eukprot:87825-Prymnesium_polylepis.1
MDAVRAQRPLLVQIPGFASRDGHATSSAWIHARFRSGLMPPMPPFRLDGSWDVRLHTAGEKNKYRTNTTSVQ